MQAISATAALAVLAACGDGAEPGGGRGLELGSGVASTPLLRSVSAVSGFEALQKRPG